MTNQEETLSEESKNLLSLIPEGKDGISQKDLLEKSDFDKSDTLTYLTILMYPANLIEPYSKDDKTFYRRII